MSRLLRLEVGLFTAMTVACQGDGHLGDNDCPPDDLLREIHAAAFFFEHGSPSQAQRYLASAQSKMRHTGSNDTVTELMGRLRTVAALPDGQDQIKVETEQIRARLTHWSCLTDTLHAEFHRHLPPIP